MIRLRPIDRALLAAVLCLSTAAQALEFRSVSETGTVFHAAPDTASRKLFVVSQFYPVEVVDTQQDWSRVRDSSGQLAWVQSSRLIERRYVVVNVERSVLRQAPQVSAPAVLTVEKNVVLELIEPPSSMWARVRHDGKTAAYVRVQDIWGI